MSELRGLDASGVQTVAALLAVLRANGIPARILSGRRSIAHNRSVGGAPLSRHLSGRAFDLELFGLPRASVPLDYWRAVGRLWESAGGRWGGRFNDVNHFDW